MAPGEASIHDDHYGGPRPAPRRAVRPKTAAEKAFCALGPTAEAFITGAAAAGNTRLGPELAELNTLAAAHGQQAFLDALARAVAFGRWRAADVRSILAAGTGTPQPTTAGDALVLELPRVPTRPLSDYALGGPPAPRPTHRRHRDREVVVSAAAPALAPDLADGLRRLKLAAMRQLAPELLLTAKTQRWAPEELLRTLVEAEITARDASNARTRLKTAAFPVVKTLDEFDRAVSTINPATLDYLASLGVDHRRGRTSAWSDRPAPARATCSSRSASPPCKPGTGSATSPPPSWSKPSTAAWPTTASDGSSTPCSATT